MQLISRSMANNTWLSIHKHAIYILMTFFKMNYSSAWQWCNLLMFWNIQFTQYEPINMRTVLLCFVLWRLYYQFLFYGFIISKHIQPGCIFISPTENKLSSIQVLWNTETGILFSCHKRRFSHNLYFLLNENCVGTVCRQTAAKHILHHHTTH